jgi:leucyl aminopeptidase
MSISIHLSSEFTMAKPVVLLIQLDEENNYSLDLPIDLSAEESSFIANYLEKKIYLFRLPRASQSIFLHFIKEKSDDFVLIDKYRVAGSILVNALKKYKFDELGIWFPHNKNLILAYIEGFMLSAYTFEVYKSDKEDLIDMQIQVLLSAISQTDIDELLSLVEGVYLARDLVNEPGSNLTAVELSNRIEKAGKSSGFYTETLNKAKIESLKMGGLLAVNRGSLDPPTFTIMEWKPKNPVNKKPIVLVGKGVVFDTGGLSLKPTANSMDHMKCDMSGAATVAGVMYAIAKSDFNVHVVGLVPATDNRPGQNAYYPGDVINMYDGSTVEVLNTDAEGRMLLADALAYAKNYDPQLVIDIATLTGSSAMAIGKYGIVSFSNSDEDENLLSKSGEAVYERLVRFPIWEEYAELIKSDIADVKNIGGPQGGAITAAKFLERFTDYNWIHLDIAGPAFIQKDYKYFTKGGTAIGVRLIFDFLKKININE